MALTGVEAVVLDVIATLRNGMTTELAVLEAEYQDSVALPVPDAAAYFWYVPELLPSYPTFIIRPLPESGALVSMSSQYRTTYAIQLDIITRQEDIATSDLVLWRYWRAVKELILPAGALVEGDCSNVDIEWSQPLIVDPKSGDELRDVPGLLTVNTYESRD